MQQINNIFDIFAIITTIATGTIILVPYYCLYKRQVSK